jgi:hypothetical protein
MAIVSVTLNPYNFTATIQSVSGPAVTINGQPVQVVSTITNQVTVNNSSTRVGIVDSGIMTILSASTSTIDEFVGNGIKTVFTLTEEVLSSDFVEVVVGGVVQNPGLTDSYYIQTFGTGTSTATSMVHFTEAPPAGIDILTKFYSIKVAQDLIGPQGPQGPQGEQGPPGETGPKGDTGPMGPGASNLTWYTLPYMRDSNGPGEIAIGKLAGWTSGNSSISIGEEAGRTNQAAATVAVGQFSGWQNQALSAVAVGSEAARINQGSWGIAVGRYAGYSAQGQDAVAIGHRAGTETQGIYSVGLGPYAAERRQGDYAVAIGNVAGQIDQGDNSVAVGVRAGQTSQGAESVAIGHWASTSTQGDYSVSIGRYAGESLQGTRTVAIGNRAGEYNQGNFSVAIGGLAGGTNLPANTIVLNAQGSLPSGSIALNPTTSGFFVKPVRRVGSVPAGFLPTYYNPTTGEFIVVG